MDPTMVPATAEPHQRKRRRVRPQEIAMKCRIPTGDGYECGRVIGSGSFATVYSCTTDNSVVIKKLDRGGSGWGDKGNKQVFNEIALMYKASGHRNVVGLKGWFTDERSHICLVMENCEGGTLASLLKAKAGGQKRVVELFTEWQIMRWFCQITAALHHLHSCRIMHRDIKPDNIFLTKSRRTIKLGDLGVGRELEGSNDMATTMMGTPYYMSPEVMAGRPYSYASDVWALGCVLYEMAARKIAFDACGLPQLVVKVMRNEWEPLPTYYTAPFRRLVRLLLQPDPSQRPTCDQILGIRYVRECFEGILASMPPTAAAKLARQVFPESPYTAAPLEPARLHPEVSRMSKAPRRKKARGVPATGRPSATAERPKTSYLKPTGSSTAKAEEGVRKKETIMSKQRRELEKDVGAAARKKSSSAASGSAAESSRTTRRGTRRMGKSKSVATMSVKTAKRDWEARAALSDMREELAQRRWMAREMEAKRGRQLVRIRQMEQEAAEDDQVAVAEQMRIQKAQMSILEDQLGATAAEIGTAAAFVTMDRLPRSQTPPPAWHRLEGTKEDTESAERGERREWAQFLGTCDSMGSTSGATDSPSLGAPSPTGHPAMTALPAIPEAAGAFSATTSAASREAEGGAGGSAQGIGVAWATGPAASDVAGAHELDRTAGPGSGRGSEGEDGREGTAVLQERSAVHKELDEAPGAPAPAQVASTAWGSGPTLRSPTRYGHRLGGPWGLGAMTVEESGALQELHAAVSAAPEQQWELIRAMWEVTMATTLGGSASEEERESESGTERESEDSWWSGRERGGQCEGPKGQAGSASDDGEEAHLEGTGREGSLSRVPTGDADGTGREGMEGRDRDARDVGGEENAQGVERGWLHIPPQEVALAGEAEGGAASQDLPGGSGRSAERTADGGREGESARGGTPSGGGTMEAAGAPRGEGHLWERLEGLDDTWDGSTDAPLPELLSGGLSSGNDSASDMEDLGELRRRARVRQGAEEGATGSGRAEPGWGDAGGERSNVREMYDAGYQESEPGPAPRLESDTVAIPGPATAPYRSPLSASDSDGLVLLSSASGLVGDLGEGSQSSDRGVVLMAQAVRGSSGKGMASLNEEMAEDMVGGGDPGHSPGPDTLLVDSSEAVAKAPLNVIIPHENSPAGRGASGSPGSPSGAAEHSPAGRSNDTDVPSPRTPIPASISARLPSLAASLERRGGFSVHVSPSSMRPRDSLPGSPDRNTKRSPVSHSASRPSQPDTPGGVSAERRSMESAAGKSEGSEAWGAVVDASPHGISQQLAASDVSIGIKASGAPSPVGRVTSLPAVGSPDAAALRTSGLGYQETDLANVGITEGVGGPTIEEEARGDETIRDGEGTEGSEDESDLISMDESSGGGWSRRSGWGGQEEWEEEEEAEEVVWSDGASESSYGGHADATESEDDYSDSFEDEEEDEDEEDEDEEEEEEEGGEKEGGVRRAYDLAVERMLSLSIRKRD